MINVRHIGRPPLWSYLTADMGAPWDEEHAYVEMEFITQLPVDGVATTWTITVATLLVIGELVQPIWGPDNHKLNLWVPDPQVNSSELPQRE